MLKLITEITFVITKIEAIKIRYLFIFIKNLLIEIKLKPDYHLLLDSSQFVYPSKIIQSYCLKGAYSHLDNTPI